MRNIFALIGAIALIATTLTACTSTSSQTESSDPAVESPGEVQRVTLEESKAAFDSGEATFLDVRSEASYRARHIPGALSIPLADLETRIGELDPNQWIISYCT